MNIIVFDLEWNQCPYGEAGAHPRLPFEIIEIGAVKLNEKLEKTGEFRRLVRPKLYPKLHHVIRDMLSYTAADLKRDGVPFPEACGEFRSWCGENPVFCTWGTSDLYCLQSNMDFYGMERMRFPLKYYNIQQIYADRYSPDGKICKLEKAVEALGISEALAFHAAINDARYTARVMQLSDLGDFSEKYTFDIYRHPKRKEDEIEDFHDGIFEEITEEYPGRREAFADPHITEICCTVCGRKTSRKIRWFQTNQSTEMAVGRCLLHGYMQGVIRVKSAGDCGNHVFLIKKVSPIDKDGVERIRKKRTDMKNRGRKS